MRVFTSIRGYCLSGYPTSKQTGNRRIFFRIGLRVGTIRPRPFAIPSSNPLLGFVVL